MDVWGEETTNILLYIDNSNVFEEARKFSAKKKKYINGIADIACRIDVGRLIRMAVGNRELLHGKLYGSVPPALDSVWEAIRRKNVEVKTFERSKWTMKEKQVDQALTAEAVEDIMETKHVENRTLVLFSGDLDLFPVVRIAIKHGCQVELWSFSGAVNNDFKKLEKEDPINLKVYEIDSIFKEITYTKFLWGKEDIPRERSLVTRVSLDPEWNFLEKKTFLRQFVEKSCDIFKMPMMGKYLEDYKYILLVPCLRERRKTKKDQMVIESYVFNKHVWPFVFQLDEFYKERQIKIQTWIDFANSRRPKKEENGFASYNRFQELAIDDDDDEISANVLFDDETEDINENEFFFSSDDDEDYKGNYIAVVRKETKMNKPDKSTCIHKFWCRKGKSCPYGHTREEYEYFDVQPSDKYRRFYKIKLCYHSLQGTCNYSSKRYLCGYAHSLEESRCLCCKEGSGYHWMDQCPNNTLHNNM